MLSPKWRHTEETRKMRNEKFHYLQCILLVTCHGACLWFSPIPTKSILRIINSLITAFFWAVTQRVVVISHDIAEQPIGPIFIVCPKNTATRCVMTQKSAVLI